jgi:hypothetical protein
MRWTEEQLIVMIVDATEGNLSPSQQVLLYEFIAENPQFSHYLEDLPFLVQDNVDYPNKKALIKNEINDVGAYASLNDSLDEKLIIGDMEGLLTDNEATFFRLKMKSDDFIAMQNAYLATRLQKDKSIVYKNKKQLLHKEPRFNSLRYLWLSMGAAAVGFLFYFSGLNVAYNKTKLAQNNDGIYTKKTQLKSSVKPYQETKKFTVITPKEKKEEYTVYIPKDIIEKPENSVLISRLETVQLKNIICIREEVKIETAQKHTIITSPIYRIESHSKEYASLGDLVIKKLKKVVFGNEEIDNQEQLTMITQKINHQTGLDIAYLRNEKVDESGFYFKLGAISVERKKANL